MELDSRYVGLRSETLEHCLTPRQTMNYAAAVGDANPMYFDDERPDGIIAPPMLAVALTWPLSSQFEHYWRNTGFPMEYLARQVHYSEVIVWERTMRPGDRIRIRGVVQAMLPHPAGTHLILRYDAEDSGGNPLFHEYIGGILRGVRCTDGGCGAGELPPPYRFKAQGEPRWSAKLHVDLLAAHIYDGCADIAFPIHTSPAFAKSVGLPGPIYFGTATLALALRETVNREAEGDPARLAGVHCNFTGMVAMGSHIHVQSLGREQENGAIRIFFHVLNAEGKTAIRNGCALLRA